MSVCTAIDLKTTRSNLRSQREYRLRLYVLVDLRPYIQIRIVQQTPQGLYSCDTRGTHKFIGKKKVLRLALACGRPKDPPFCDGYTTSNYTSGGGDWRDHAGFRYPYRPAFVNPAISHDR